MTSSPADGYETGAAFTAALASMTAALKLGIAGLGNAGRAVICDLTAVPNVALAAVADLRREALAPYRSNPVVATFDSVDAMCRSDAVDAVWIATPNEFHAEHTIAAARNGKHVERDRHRLLHTQPC